jgi:hypothetical protein
VAVVQYTFTQKQYTELNNEQNTENRTYTAIIIVRHTKKLNNLQN